MTPSRAALYSREPTTSIFWPRASAHSPRIFQSVIATTSAPRSVVSQKMLRQPASCVRNPPTKGPSEPPEYTAATVMPSARPRCSGGYTEVTMAVDVPNIMASEKPWSARRTISMCSETESVHRADTRV